MKKSVIGNYLLNLFYQILVIALPLITTPYVSNIFAPEVFGSYTYTQSYVTYFTLLGCVGIGLYGQREIAYVQDDTEKRSKLLFELVSLKAITISIALACYLVFVGVYQTYLTLFLIQCIDIIANMFDINFFYQGMENFKRIVSRNILIRIIGIICVFTFVKQESDLYLYVVIQSLSLLGGNLLMWCSLKKYIVKVKSKLEIKKHFKPTLVLFLPQIAVSIYTVLDRTMIGLLSDTAQCGLYEQAQKIVKLALTIVTSLGTVMLPRIAAMYSQDNQEKIVEYIYTSLRFILMIAIAMTFGLIAVADNLIPWFLDETYLGSIPILRISAPLCILIGISNVIGLQFLLPTKKQKEYTLSTIFGSLVNVCVNFLLIPSLLASGAALASIIAEAAVTISQLYFVKDEIHFMKVLNQCKFYVIGSVLMFIIVYPCASFLAPSMVNTLLCACIGVIVYFVVLMVCREPLIYDFVKKLKRKEC